MARGQVTGIAGGALVGWIEAADGERPELEAFADGPAPFGRARSAQPKDGRAAFSIPIPEAFSDRTVRFLDVRPVGCATPLDGGPVIHDGGLGQPSEAFTRAAEIISPLRAWATVPSAAAGEAVEGAVEHAGPAVVSGWIQQGHDDHSARVEILANGRLVAAVAADQPLRGRANARRKGFSADLSRLLRRGPFNIVVRVEAAEQPLPGGRFSAGPFPADGEVDLPGYLDGPGDRAFLESLAFEHQARDALRMSADRTIPRLINRLRRERIVLAERSPGRAVLIDLDGDQRLERAWSLQSHPNTDYRLANGRAEAIRRAAGGADYVFFGRAGDFLHPSAAGIAALAGGPDVLFWSRFHAETARAGSPGVVLRRPRFDPVTFRHGAATDSTLAVRGSILAAAPGAVLTALAKRRFHPLIFWLAGQDLRWAAHAEALTTSLHSFAPPDRAEFLKDEELCRAILSEEHAAFTLERTGEDRPVPFVLTPTRQARKISVLISFRDESRPTLRCLNALARQRLTGELEIVLVDNRSAPTEARAVIEGAHRLLGESRVKLVAHNAPFNHGAQSNLAARAATGDVIVICGAGVALEDESALEQLAAWALRPGVGSVGCRLETPERRAGSYGYVFAPLTDDPFQPLLRESDEPTYAGHVHACAGNTLALAAIARDRFLALGGLDEARFRAGYTGMDYMLRASAAGQTHLYLGHLRARRDRSPLPTGDDEDLQAVLINQLHGAQASGRFFQLATQRIGAVDTRPGAREAAALAELEAEKAAVAGEIDLVTRARRDLERRRAETAAVLARASDLAARLAAGDLARAEAAEPLAELNRELAARALED